MLSSFMTEEKADSANRHHGPRKAAMAATETAEGMPVLAARAPPGPLSIVAIGASAGGLEAASKLVALLPAKTGMAFILIQHLDPTHKSLLAELLAEHTAMTVAEATDGGPLLANHIYVIPPGTYLSVRAGAVHLSPPLAHHGARLPFDFLLASLATDCGARTTCIVLSGTGADGSGGIPALKAAGGHIIAQDPQEAEFNGMPTSAIATGAVDQILTLSNIPAALTQRHPQPVPKPVPGPVEQPGTESPAGVAAIVALLKQTTPHDFTHYKPGTLERRVARRMALLGLERGNLAGYLDLLRQSEPERDLLAQDILINVTSFFRDPKVFDALADTIVPDLIKQLPENRSLRVWIAGCSTGEEAYSIAMICRDAIQASGRKIRLQVFASDVDPDAIAVAREGHYASDRIDGIDPDRLTRYFVKDELGFRVAAGLRGDVVFTVQDLLTDPPFSRIDLVSCRNLLIYLNPEAQSKVMSLFHFALREGGVLLLGSAETVGSDDDKFTVIAKSERLYRHVVRSRVSDPGFPLSFDNTLPVLGKADAQALVPRQATLAEICGRAMMVHHAPAAILINAQRQCLYATGRTDRYLRIAPGYASHDVLAMAPPALRTKLRIAIDKAARSTDRIDGGRVRLAHDAETIWFNFDAQALPAEQEGLMLICFVEESGGTEGSPAHSSRSGAVRIAELEHELEATQAELQTAILTLETSSQEQKAINEEALSVNEEFQSTNEELLTSKEELQSLNEELTALNSQLQETLERQRLTSDDLQNVLYSTNVGTLFLDLELRIRFYTPAIKSLYSIIAGDVGRPLADLRPIAVDPALLLDAKQVLADGTSIEREIGGPGDTWFLRRIFPYRAHTNRVEGVVITFADVTERKFTARALEAAKLEAERANLAKSRFLAAASHDLRQPLQSLTLLQELLVRSDDEDKRQKLLARFDLTLGAMSGMLNALLDINQIEAGVIEARTVSFPLADVLERLRGEFTYLAQSRNLALHILPTTALVDSDPRLLEQMIRNLLGNAIKYTRTGKILLGCRRRGGALRIEVWDTGIGIAEDELHAIFDEFHQIDNDARERARGLGLGLSIVQRLGHLLGHVIDVRSIVGKGSVFSIAIDSARPAYPQPLPVVEAPAGEVGMSRHRCKIVIVEDDPDILELLEDLVKRDGHIVRTAVGADAALKLVAGGAIRPELLLTDYNLPGPMNGLELLEALRANRPDGLPAIVLTGDISTETLAKIAQQDCLQLSKPVKSQELSAAIARLCPQEARQTEARQTQAEGPRDIGVPIAYIIDDDPEIRATIRDVLEGDGRTVQDFASAEAFLADYRPVGTGCLLLDLHLPGMSGLALIDTLRERGDHVPTILITGKGDIGLAVHAMRSGACDFIEKPVGRSALLASIGRAIDASHELRLSDAGQEDAAAHISGLTKRQREVMDMVLAGHPSKNIAADLGISQRTVENHRAAIMRKMESKSLPELARKAQAAEGHPHNQGSG